MEPPLRETPPKLLGLPEPPPNPPLRTEDPELIRLVRLRLMVEKRKGGGEKETLKGGGESCGCEGRDGEMENRR